MNNIRNAAPARLARYFLASAAIVALTGVAAAPSYAAELQPKGASVTGTGEVNGNGFDINAQALTKKSSAASGYANFDLAIGHVDGQVSCVEVLKGVAGITGTLGAGTTAVDISQSPGFVLYISEGGKQGPDLLQLTFLTYVPPTCTPQQPFSPAAVTSGDIRLRG